MVFRGVPVFMHRYAPPALSLRLCFSASTTAVDFFFCLSKPPDIRHAPEPHPDTAAQSRLRRSNLPSPNPALQRDPTDPDSLGRFARGEECGSHDDTLVSHLRKGCQGKSGAGVETVVSFVAAKCPSKTLIGNHL